MKVIKRSGKTEDVHFDKITERIRKLTLEEPILNVDSILIAQKVINGLYPMITTVQLDELAAETAISLTTLHPDYESLAARITMSNLHKQTKSDFYELCTDMINYISPKTNKPAPLINEEYYKIVCENRHEIQSMFRYERDYTYDYFGLKTMMKSYLYKMNKIIVERPQHMIMRTAIALHGSNLAKVQQTYKQMSLKYYTHATPTLFNAGSCNQQLSSCFLLDMVDDSIEGIYDTLKRTALISKGAGGIGIALHKIRSNGSHIKTSNGTSTGTIPMLRVFNETAKYVDQGSKRNGSFAMYMEPHHPDIEDFLDLRKNTGDEDQRCRDLFLALWVSDLFMKRVQENGDWSLFDPDECPGLYDVYGDEYEKLYIKYEQTPGAARKTMKAQTLWRKIIISQIETGTPYMTYKDAINKHNNQSNLGTIKSSNLCVEVCEYTSPKEVAVCNLASISLKSFVHEIEDDSFEENGGENNNKNNNKKFYFSHQDLYDICYNVTINLNRAIDVTKYPLKEAQYSNLKHRPIGLGVQGLADTFFMLRIPFDSAEARQLNQDIAETMYYAACRASCDLAKIHGPYETFAGSPASKGILIPDMWDHKPSDRWDFSTLRNDVMTYGMRNSLLIALMPTASTASILGNIEAFEPISSNIYSRNVSAGTFPLVNKYLVNDLIKLGLWNKAMKDKIIKYDGSIQQISEIPEDIRTLYRTVWELSMKDLIDMSADRCPYVCQSQSLNIFMESPNYSKMSSMHFYGWKRGLKTGMYYLRTRGAASAIKFTLDASDKVNKIQSKPDENYQVCTMSEGCLSCGS